MKSKPKFYGACVKCLDCGEILQSKHVHDWVACSCYGDETKPGGIYVDGGGDYMRMGWKAKSAWEVTKHGKYMIAYPEDR